MWNNVYIIIICLALNISVFGQLLEAESRPYRFSIDMMLEIEAKTESQSFDILPYKVQISLILEEQLAKWFGNNPHGDIDVDNLDELVAFIVKKSSPEAIQIIGLKAFENTRTHSFFIEESLQFEIQLNEFKPFKISIPLAEVESFQNNFEKIQFSNQKFTMNENDQFVITYIHIYNPENEKKYIFYNTEDGTVQAPSFSVSLPKVDLL